MKEDIEEILRLHKEYSARFSNYVLKSLIEENGDKKNIALSPSRLQAILVLLANWTTPNVLTSSLKKHVFYNLLINNILYLCVT